MFIESYITSGNLTAMDFVAVLRTAWRGQRWKTQFKESRTLGKRLVKEDKESRWKVQQEDSQLSENYEKKLFWQAVQRNWRKKSNECRIKRSDECNCERVRRWRKCERSILSMMNGSWRWRIWVTREYRLILGSCTQRWKWRGMRYRRQWTSKFKYLETVPGKHGSMKGEGKSGDGQTGHQCIGGNYEGKEHVHWVTEQ